jgi:hypothetical protein
MLDEVRDFATAPTARSSDATEPQADGYLLSVRCPWGVWFMRWMTPGEAARELVLSELLVSES